MAESEIEMTNNSYYLTLDWEMERQALIADEAYDCSQDHWCSDRNEAEEAGHIFIREAETYYIYQCIECKEYIRVSRRRCTYEE